MRLAMPSVFWSHTATVYRPNASGKYSTVALASVRCRLAVTGYEPSGVDPVMMQPTTRVYFPPDTVLPADEGYQLLIGGVRWNPRHGSQKAPAPLGAAVVLAVDVVRAEV